MSKTPITADDLTILDNKSDGEQPFDLVDLKRRNSLFLSNIERDSEPKLELIKIAERNLWQDDMAVLKLSIPLGDSLGFFGCQLYRDAWEGGNYWTKCGYPGAVASGLRPSRVTWFPIIDDDNDGQGVELEYRADGSPGDSGGPVFGWWDDGYPYVIGTHSGGEEEYEFPFSIIKNNVAAGGAVLSNLIGWARSNW
jgi:hypothetical protein